MYSKVEKKNKLATLEVLNLPSKKQHYGKTK